MMKAHSQPTMKDVARAAGVSLGTVSRVFNGFAVGEEYRVRVEEAAGQLNYRVNNYARGLKTSSTRCVGVLMPSLCHPFFAALTDAVTACLMSRGYLTHVMLTNFDPDAEQKSFTLVEQNKVDGIIALTYRPDLELDSSIPVVSFDRHLNGETPCVSSDNFGGGQLAAEKLRELGCEKLLFLRIGPSTLGEADLRGPGFEEACRRMNVPFHSLRLNYSETEEPIYRLLDSNLKDGRLSFDGVFCNSDGLARRVCLYLEDHGVRIPEDVQVIGYDGTTDFATGRYICSTIVQPVAEMAEAAVELLLGERGEGTESCSVVLPVTYAAGGTTRDSLRLPAEPYTGYNPFRLPE